RTKKKSAHWYIDYKAADGTRKRVKGFKDKQATAQLAAKLEKESELAQAGIVDRYAEHRKKPLRQHLEDFHQALLAKGDTVQGPGQARGYAQKGLTRRKDQIRGQFRAICRLLLPQAYDGKLARSKWSASQNCPDTNEAL
ncbi:MAG: hypothetical protein ACYSTF_05890, partial [Planctomycetota bacterium]